MKTEINYQRIGRNLKQARKKNDKTQRAVADFLNIQDTSYSNLECGHEKISLRRVIELCEYFGILPGDVLNDCTEKLFLLAQQPKADASSIEKGNQELQELLQQCASLSNDQIHFLVLVASQMVMEKKGKK